MVFNSEEESKPSFQQNPTQSGAETVQFHKYGHPTKVIQKTASVLYYPDTPPSTNSSQSGKRLLSCSDSEDQDETPARRTKFDDLARPVELEPQNLEKAKAMMVSRLNWWTFLIKLPMKWIFDIFTTLTSNMYLYSNKYYYLFH